jgi:hypothetical protein
VEALRCPDCCQLTLWAAEYGWSLRFAEVQATKLCPFVFTHAPERLVWRRHRLFWAQDAVSIFGLKGVANWKVLGQVELPWLLRRSAVKSQSITSRSLAPISTVRRVCLSSQTAFVSSSGTKFLSKLKDSGARQGKYCSQLFILRWSCSSS